MAAVLAAVLASNAFAQVRLPRPGLSGLNDFGLLLEPLDADARSCGIDLDRVDTSLRFVLQQSKMKISSNAYADPYVYVQVTVLSNCAILTALSVNTAVTIQKTQTSILGARIWDKANISTGSRANATQRLTEALEGMAKQLVIDWATANPQ